MLNKQAEIEFTFFFLKETLKIFKRVYAYVKKKICTWA